MVILGVVTGEIITCSRKRTLSEVPVFSYSVPICTGETVSSSVNPWKRIALEGIIE
jgi:hypothetical protein